MGVGWGDGDVCSLAKYIAVYEDLIKPSHRFSFFYVFFASKVIFSFFYAPPIKMWRGIMLYPLKF